MPSRSFQVTSIQIPTISGTTDAENSPFGSSAEMLPFPPALRYRHDGIAESAGSRKHNPNNSRHLPRDALDMTATETFDMFRRFWLKYCEAMESFDHGSGHRILAPTFNTCANTGIH